MTDIGKQNNVSSPNVILSRSRIFCISDTHFGHENILKFKDAEGNVIRNFPDVFEMDEIMIRNWNAVVEPQDKVYHLGDVFFGGEETAKRVLPRLNGKKRLIVGNHDNIKSVGLHKYFQKIGMWRMFPEFGLLLTHVPVHPSTLREGRFEGGREKMINVHGHIHHNKSPEGPYKCVCVEHINYTPVPIEELANG